MKNKTSFKCSITDSLLSEYDAAIDIVTSDISYKGTYWEAVACFENNDFILNALSQTDNGINEIELLRFSVKKIKDTMISVITSRSSIKTYLIVCGFFCTFILLGMLLHPSPGFDDVGTVIFITLFLGIGIPTVFYVLGFFFIPSEKILRINLLLYDNRVITLFADPVQEELIRRILNTEFFNTMGIRMS